MWLVVTSTWAFCLVARMTVMLLCQYTVCSVRCLRSITGFSLIRSSLRHKEVGSRKSLKCVRLEVMMALSSHTATRLGKFAMKEMDGGH